MTRNISTMNLNGQVSSVELITKISPKTGNQYTQLVVTFKNGYVYQGFLNSEQVFIINSMIAK